LGHRDLAPAFPSRNRGLFLSFVCTTAARLSGVLLDSDRVGLLEKTV